ncbi:MAG: GHKL domain-containing protein [Coprococcus sp.]
MLNQWISIIAMASTAPILGYAMEMMQRIKPNSGKRWMRITFWTVVCFLMAVNKVFSNGDIIGTILGDIIFIVACAISFRFFYDGSFWRKTAVCIMVVVAEMSAEFGFLVLKLLYHIDTLSMDFRQTDMMLGSLSGAMFASIALFFLAFLWRWFEKRSRMPRGSWIFVLMPLCLMIPSFQYYLEAVRGNGEVALIHLVAMGGALVLDLLLVCIQFNQAEKDSLEKELRELRYQNQLERQHYQNVEARREEMAKIRHDYNNLLTSVLGLLHMGKSEEAEQAITTLLSRVEQTREYPYCGIPIVNVILAEKQKDCEKNGITLQIDLLIPEDVAVDQIDLCSAFSNLLDNAIRACIQLPPEKTRIITLNVGIQGDYLIIRCDNPAKKAPGERPEGSGYGNKILKDIARRYNGSFCTEFSEGTYTARLVLLEIR